MAHTKEANSDLITRPSHFSITRQGIGFLRSATMTFASFHQEESNAEQLS